MRERDRLSTPLTPRTGSIKAFFKNDPCDLSPKLGLFVFESGWHHIAVLFKTP